MQIFKLKHFPYAQTAAFLILCKAALQKYYSVCQRGDKIEMFVVPSSTDPWPVPWTANPELHRDERKAASPAAYVAHGNRCICNIAGDKITCRNVHINDSRKEILILSYMLLCQDLFFIIPSTEHNRLLCWHRKPIK